MLINRVLCSCPRMLPYLSASTRLKISKNRSIGIFNAFQPYRNMSMKNFLNFEKSAEAWAVKDKLSPSYQLIYRAPMSKYIVFGGSTTIVFSIVAVSFGLFTYLFSDTKLDHAITIDEQVYSSNFTEVIMCTSFIGVITLVAFILTRRYVLRIYRDHQNYVAVYTGILPGWTNQLKFVAGEAAVVQERLGIVPWSSCLFKIKGKKSILLEDHFKTYHDFKVMLGGNI